MKKLFSALVVVSILSVFSIAVVAATTPIVDGTNIINDDKSWDAASHSLPALLVERGNGFVNFVVPRSPNNTTAWGVHAYVTLYNATVNDVYFYSDTLNKLEINGDNGATGPGSMYDDEVDWYGDLAQVNDASARGINNSSNIEFWFATNSARDAFTAELSYGFCPRMKIELVDPDFYASTYPQTEFKAGDTSYLYGSTIYLGDCTVAIDIKPGSDPNCFNNDGNGVIPVAINGSAEFDVSLINVWTLDFASMTVAAKGKDGTKPLANIEDWNGDGFDDLVVKFEDSDGQFDQGTGTATVTGNLYDGTPFEGSDSICITQ